MKFAADLFRRAADSYRTAIPAAKEPTLKEALLDLLNEAERNLALMEQIRRENITEMILEPITGLVFSDDAIGTSPDGKAGNQGLLKWAADLESTQLGFFERAAVRIPLQEAARAFRKIAEKKRSNLDRLHSLKID